MHPAGFTVEGWEEEEASVLLLVVVVVVWWWSLCVVRSVCGGCELQARGNLGRRRR